MQWPKVVRQIIPSYTPGAMRAKVQGTVGMEMVILDDGSVGQTRVTRSLDKGLDEQAQIVARYLALRGRHQGWQAGGHEGLPRSGVQAALRRAASDDAPGSVGVPRQLEGDTSIEFTGDISNEL